MLRQWTVDAFASEPSRCASPTQLPGYAVTVA